MKDQFDNIPQELEQAALVDGCSAWGAFFRIILPIALGSSSMPSNPLKSSAMDSMRLSSDLATRTFVINNLCRKTRASKSQHS